VERWFREITDKRIRRGVFRHARQLVNAIMDYVEHHDENPTTFIWTPRSRTSSQRPQAQGLS